MQNLQRALKEQMRAPKLFNARPLTGPIIASLMPELARALNEGVELLPKSLYEQCEARRAEMARFVLIFSDSKL
jgi:hypothetical protein